MPLAEGCSEACSVRGGVDGGSSVCCEMSIPPLSWNPAHYIQYRSVTVSVLASENDKIIVSFAKRNSKKNGNISRVSLNRGQEFVLWKGETFQIHNTSATSAAHLKILCFRD